MAKLTKSAPAATIARVHQSCALQRLTTVCLSLRAKTSTVPKENPVSHSRIPFFRQDDPQHSMAPMSPLERGYRYVATFKPGERVPHRVAHREIPSTRATVRGRHAPRRSR